MKGLSKKTTALLSLSASALIVLVAIAATMFGAEVRQNDEDASGPDGFVAVSLEDAPDDAVKAVAEEPSEPAPAEPRPEPEPEPELVEAPAEPELEAEPAPVEMGQANRKPNVKKTSAKKPAKKLEPALLQVVTNFDKADVTVNGIPYPEYTEPGEPEGMVLPAGGPYHIEVQYDGNTKSYRLNLRPHETRLLLVDLSGFQGAGKAPSRPARASKPEKKKEEKKKEDEGDEQGKVTVYSKPPGVIMIDGKKTPEKTPGTIDVESGRHEIQVEYETGTVSEKKIVRVRKGSRIKLFFRDRSDNNDDKDEK